MVRDFLAKRCLLRLFTSVTVLLLSYRSTTNLSIKANDASTPLNVAELKRVTSASVRSG